MGTDMADLASKSFFVVLLIIYSTLFNSANIVTANDAWLWPDEVESKIDERPAVRTQKIFTSSVDEGLTMRQVRPAIVYPNNPVKLRPNANSVWKRLNKTIARKPDVGLAKPTNSTNDYGSNKNPSFTQAQSQTSIAERDWSFPQENLIRRKADLRCAEYNKAIEAKDVWINPMLSNWRAGASKKTSPNKCKGLQNPLIIGGFTALPGEFSHMAALGWFSPNNETSFLCGGSLISDHWVITAAHCTHGPLGSPKVVFVGSSRLSDESAGKLIRVREIVRHPSYKPPAVYADLALLKLDKKLKFGPEIKPACLWTEFDTTPLKAWATGWGVTEIGEERSDDLLKVRLDIVDNVDCAIKLNRSAAIPRGIVPSMLCAGDIGGDWRSDTCQGDSGGPLQILHPNYKCLYQIIGITSFGRLCALRNSPGVYTRISHHIEWIESVVWPDNRR